MPKVTIDGVEIEVPLGATVLRACVGGGMRTSAILASMLLAGCSQIEHWRHPELAVCEEYIAASLRSPSTYERARATISDSRLPLAYWMEDLRSAPESIRPLLADQAKERAKHGGRRIVLVEYDAQNAFGAPVRGIASCKFEMKSTENNEFTSEPSATLAKADAVLAQAGVRGAAGGCCESNEKMARFEKFEPEARYLSQQVLN
jgi:hypothetical protein